MNTSTHVAAVELALSDSVRLVPAMIVESALFGVLSLLFLFSTIALLLSHFSAVIPLSIPTSLLSQQGINVRPRVFMLTATMIMYMASATHWGLNLYTMMLEISEPDVWTTLPIEKPWLWSVVTTIALFMNFWISDMVVMWRACVVWAWRRDVNIIFSVFVITPVILATVDVSTARPSAKHNTFQPNTFGLAALLVSLLSNIWATTLVGRKAWIHRKNIRALLDKEGKTSAAYNILAILTESGFLYCGIWAMFIVTTIINGKSPSGATHAIAGAVPQLVGLYPTIIVLLVALRKTHCDQEFTYSSPRRRTATRIESIVFADVSHQRSTVASAENAVTLERSNTQLDKEALGDEAIFTHCGEDAA